MKSTLPAKLTVAVLSVIHVMELNKTTDNRYEITGGMEGLFLKDVLTQLGMEYELVIPSDGENGRYGRNGNWTGLIGMAARGDADLACGGLAILEERRRVVDFSTPYFIDTVTFAIKRAEKLRLKNVYLYPFRINVWASFFGTMVVMPAALWLAFKRKYSFDRILFEFCGSVMKQPFSLLSNSWKTKFLLGLCFGYSLLMTTCYSGLLLSFMTIPIEGVTVETVRQLSEAIAKGTHRCFVPQGTITSLYLIWSKEPHFKLLGKAVIKNKWYANKNAPMASLGNNDAVIAGRTFFNLHLYQNNNEQKSKYLISNDVMATATMGFAINRNFCCTKRLNKIILRIVEAGMPIKYIRETAFKYWISERKWEEEEELKEYRISLEDILGALIILGTGYTFSFITLIAEILFSKYSGLPILVITRGLCSRLVITLKPPKGVCSANQEIASHSSHL